MDHTHFLLLRTKIVRQPTNVTSVVSGSKNELRCSVVPWANVRDIRFSLHQHFCASTVSVCVCMCVCVCVCVCVWRRKKKMLKAANNTPACTVLISAHLFIDGFTLIPKSLFSSKETVWWHSILCYTVYFEILAVFKFGSLAPNQPYKMAEFKIGGGISGPFIKQHCRLSSQIYKK